MKNLLLWHKVLIWLLVASSAVLLSAGVLPHSNDDFSSDDQDQPCAGCPLEGGLPALPASPLIFPPVIHFLGIHELCPRGITGSVVAFFPRSLPRGPPGPAPASC